MNKVFSGTGPELPPLIVLQNPEAFEIWTIYRAFERRFLPYQILQEKASWLDDMLALDNLYEALKPEDQ